MPAVRKPEPGDAATNASSTLSTSSCRTRRQRVAPIEMRTAISRERPDARASSRLATFAHAISSTKATAPISDQNSTRICEPITCSANGVTDGGDVLVAVGIICVASCAVMPVISVRACSIVMPSASRP